MPPSSTSLWASSFYHLKTLQLTFSLPGGAGTGHKSLPLLSSSCVKGPRLPNIQFSVNKDRPEKSHAQPNCLLICSHQLEGGRHVTGHSLRGCSLTKQVRPKVPQLARVYTRETRQTLLRYLWSFTMSLPQIGAFTLIQQTLLSAYYVSGRGGRDGRSLHLSRQVSRTGSCYLAGSGRSPGNGTHRREKCTPIGGRRG